MNDPRIYNEQRVDLHRPRQYVWRWYRWLHGGLRSRVGAKGRFTRIWITVLKRLSITGNAPKSG